MAGSWGHITDDDGSLLPGGKILDMLDTGGDVVEAFEECYGMVQWLADRLAAATGGVRRDWIEQAEANYREGLEIGGSDG